jgi:hypothetical protein
MVFVPTNHRGLETSENFSFSVPMGNCHKKYISCAILSRPKSLVLWSSECCKNTKSIPVNHHISYLEKIVSKNTSIGGVSGVCEGNADKVSGSSPGGD